MRQLILGLVLTACSAVQQFAFDRGVEIFHPTPDPPKARPIDLHLEAELTLIVGLFHTEAWPMLVTYQIDTGHAGVICPGDGMIWIPMQSRVEAVVVPPHTPVTVFVSCDAAAHDRVDRPEFWWDGDVLCVADHLVHYNVHGTFIPPVIDATRYIEVSIRPTADATLTITYGGD